MEYVTELWLIPEASINLLAMHTHTLLHTKFNLPLHILTFNVKNQKPDKKNYCEFLILSNITIKSLIKIYQRRVEVWYPMQYVPGLILNEGLISIWNFFFKDIFRLITLSSNFGRLLKAQLFSHLGCYSQTHSLTDNVTFRPVERCLLIDLDVLL